MCIPGWSGWGGNLEMARCCALGLLVLFSGFFTVFTALCQRISPGKSIQAHGKKIG